MAEVGSPIDSADLRRFIAHTEHKISPREVGMLYQRAEMLARLPLPLQQWIARHAGSDDYIGFVVEPYCFFLSYEIADLDAAARLLPPSYRLAPTAMFEGTEPRLCGILGAFNVHSSLFWGTRVELYLIAEDTRTGLLSWIICDYESNTISYDPGQGFSGSSTHRAVVTTSHAGDVIVDVRSQQGANQLVATASLSQATPVPLVQRLWVEGNLSVDYGGELMHTDSVPFGLVFDPGEMAQALHVPNSAASIETNTFGHSYLAAEPFEVACFPYAQHFLTTSYPRETPIVDRSGLEAAVRALGVDET